MGPATTGGKRTLAMGTPLARLFLAAAEHDGDLVLLAEPEPACQLGGGIQNDRKQHDADAQQDRQGP